MRAEQSEFYRLYMQSEEWYEKRRQRIWVDEGRCTMCGRGSDSTKLQVHHLTYARLGHEDVMKDLATVCPECHRRLHRFYHRMR